MIPPRRSKSVGENEKEEQNSLKERERERMCVVDLTESRRIISSVEAGFRTC